MRTTPTDARAEADADKALFRSAWFWGGLVGASYLVSFTWLGPLGQAYPRVILGAPSGLFHLFGLPGFENGSDVVERALDGNPILLAMLLAVHAAFWLMLSACISQRNRMKRPDLMKAGWTLIIVLVANLVGCSTMKYST